MSIQTATTSTASHDAKRFDGFNVQVVIDRDARATDVEIHLDYVEQGVGRHQARFRNPEPSMLRALALRLLDAADQVDRQGHR